MIKGLNVNWEYLNASGASPSMPYITSGMLSAGQVRYNSNCQGLEVYDGINWHQLGNDFVNVDLSDKTKQILAWAEKKMREEQDLNRLCEKYPGLRKARDNYEVFKKFVDEQETLDSDTYDN